MEMMPALNILTAKYVIEKEIKSGIDEGLIITRHGNKVVKQHFDNSDTAEQGRKEDDLAQEYVH